MTINITLHRLIDENFDYRSEAFFEEDKNTIEIGDVLFGQEVLVRIPFINGGKKYLQLVDIHKDCSCTNISFPKEIIRPGGKGEILASIKPEEKSKFKRTLTVVSNAINSPAIIQITGTSK